MKFTLTTLIAAASLTAAGFAIAQANPPTSTAGAGCTATANAMRGGNLGSTATNKDCVSASASTAAAPAATTTTTEVAPSTTTSSSSDMGAPAAPTRMAKADRN
jgi:hypothetical protein